MGPAHVGPEKRKGMEIRTVTIEWGDGKTLTLSGQDIETVGNYVAWDQGRFWGLLGWLARMKADMSKTAVKP